MEVTIIIKDRAIYLSNSFQHVAELIINYNNCEEQYIILQADGGHDHNYMNPKNIILFLIIISVIGKYSQETM